MPRVPKYFDGLIDHLALHATPALRAYPALEKLASDPEKHRHALTGAWRAFIGHLYAAKKLPRREGVGRPPVSGAAVRRFGLRLRKLIEPDAMPVISGMVDHLLWKSRFTRGFIETLQTTQATPASLPPDVWGEPPLLECHMFDDFQLALDKLLPDDEALMPVAPDTYAAVAFSLAVEHCRVAGKAARTHEGFLLKRNSSMVAATIAAALALRRCYGLWSSGMLEAMMLRYFLRDAANEAMHPSWSRWLTTPYPSAIVNQVDRLAAFERLFFSAFTSVDALFSLAEVQGRPVPGIVRMPITVMPTDPSIAGFYASCEGPTKTLEWLLDTRASQAMWAEAVMFGSSVEPVKRWRLRFERSDAHVKEALASLAPRASQVLLETDRFAHVGGGAHIVERLTVVEAMQRVEHAQQLLERHAEQRQQRQLRRAAPADVPTSEVFVEQLLSGAGFEIVKGQDGVEQVQRADVEPVQRGGAVMSSEDTSCFDAGLGSFDNLPAEGAESGEDKP